MSGNPAAAADSPEVLRETAIRDLDSLIQVVSEAREDLRSYQSALEANRRHLAQGGRATDSAQLMDIGKVRATLTDRLDAVERARSTSRQALWRLHRAEGASIAEIARLWGFSRQLVSRTLIGRDARGSDPT